MKDVHPGSNHIISLLKACGKQKNIDKGSKLHGYIQQHDSLARNHYVASALVSMYARCSALAKAQQVLDELAVRDAVIWTALIAGCIQQGQGEEALRCFDIMQQEGHPPDAVAFMCALKACGSIGAAAKGEQIHNKIVSLGMLKDHTVLGNALVDMYARCGALAKAHQVLSELPVRDQVTWTALIAGYVQQGQVEEALKCFIDMQHEGHSPDVVTFICTLKACGVAGAAAMGEQIHNKVRSLSLLEKDVILGSTLVDMYARCGAVTKAQEVLNELPVQNAVMWTTLIAGYAQDGKGEEALKCFDSMQSEGYSPDTITYICALKACASSRAIIKGKQIHAKIVKLGILEKDNVVGNALFDMYASCSALAEAQQVLFELHVCNVVMWNALISGYNQQGQGEQALKCFDCMQSEGLSLDVVTFTCALKACASIGASTKGKEIHGKLVNLGMLEKDVVIGSTVVEMYARCSELSMAQQVFDELPIRDSVTWTALLAGCIQQGRGEEALKYFDSMQCEGQSPDAVTFMYALKACVSTGEACRSEQIHDKIFGLNILEKDIMVWNALIDMYAKCGALARAQQVLQEFPVPNVFMWNALIGGYVQHGQSEEALKCFDIMQREGQFPDAITFACALKACGSIGAAVKGEQIHNKIVALGMLEENVQLGNALIDMYARCGALTKVQQVLNKLPVKDAVSWTALIQGYTQQGQGEEALKCFNIMQFHGHTPDAITFVCALKACGSIGAADKGKQIHDEIVRLGMLEKNTMLRNTLICMYAKCAIFSKVAELIGELPIQDVVTWNALIGGYAQQGWSRKALCYFEQMQSKEIKPDSATFLCVFNACSHSGLVDEANFYFPQLSTEYGLMLGLDHYSCMVDLFGRAGMFNRALAVIVSMPFPDYLPIWLSLLGACCKDAAVKIARLSFEHALCLDRKCAAAYVFLTNMYIAAGIPKNAYKTEVMRVK